jgi:phosphomannomutase
VRRGGLDLGLATDGDGARFGVIDRDGHHVPANPVLALIADWLIGERGLAGGIARTAATTHLLDEIAALHGRTLVETRVGFGHLAPLLCSGRAALACEETGGLALASHLPQRDGLLATMLVAAMVAARRRPLRDQVVALFARVGPRHGRRIDYHVDAPVRDRMLRRLEDPPSAMAGRRVRQADAPDGLRLTFADGAWILVRASAIEPVVRCHIEARTPRDLEALTAAARDLIGRA